MQIIPVLDLLGGVVVRGIGGRRHEYRPIISRLTPSAVAEDIAQAFRDSFGLHTLYLADLDAIGGGPPGLPVYERLIALGFDLLVDAGIRDADTAAPLLAAGVANVVAGLETLSGPEALARLCQAHGDKIVFSLDLKEGQPLGNGSAWRFGSALEIAGAAWDCGVRRMIVLDLARVGVNNGIGTEELTAQLARQYPRLSIIAGGGVRGLEDLVRLQKTGVAGVLVASALHDGRLERTDLDGLGSLTRQSPGTLPI